MRLQVRELRLMIETQIQEDVYEKEHIRLHEAEGESACKLRIKPGEKYATIEPVRIIPDPARPGLYFGGEVKGSRGRGSTQLTLPAGVPVMCYQVSGSDGWFAIPSERGILRTRIHLNKFCRVTRDEQLRKMQLKKSTQGRPSKGAISDDDLLALMSGDAPATPKASTSSKPKSRAEQIAELEAQLAALRGEDMPEPAVEAGESDDLADMLANVDDDDDIYRLA